MASHNSTNTEFTRKLRAAVKAKLEEFGLDVDEELPDYVMIMVGNKKDKGRMKSELKLFLGDNTSPFVEWLFGFFQKVKTVTSSITEEVMKDKKQKVEPVEGPYTTKPISQEKKKHAKEKASKREETPESVKKEESHRSRKPRIEAPASPKVKNETKERKKDGHRHPAVETTKPKKEKEKEKHSHRKHKPSSERYEEYLTNSEYEEEEESVPTPPKLKIKSEVKYGKVEKPSRKSKKESPKRERILVQALPKREEKRREEKPMASSARQQAVVSRSRGSRKSELRPISYGEDSDVSERELSPLPYKKNVRPQIVAHSCNFDDSPPSKPKLSSKVVVMQKKPEKLSQPNNAAHSSIFKRAISDAASFSTGYGSKRTIPEEERGIQLDYEDEKPTVKKSRDKLSSYINYSQVEENTAAKNTRIIVTVKNSDKGDQHSGVTIKNEADIEEGEDGDDEQELDEEDEKQPNNIAEKQVEDVVRGSEMQEERSEEQVEEGRSDVEDNPVDKEASNEDQQVIAAVMSHLKRKRRADDLTRAFLKLSGINPKVAKILQDTEQHHSKKTPNMPSNLCTLTNESLKQPPTTAIQTIVESAAVKTEKKTETVQITSFQESLKSITRTIMNTSKNSADSSPNTPITPVWDGQINLDDFSSSDDEAEIDALLATAEAVRSANNNNETNEIIPPTAILSRPSLFKSGSTGNYATLGYNPTQYQPAYVPPVRAALNNTKMAERCRFWPDCRNEDICPFHHPTKPCANFPNCWFGDKCLYLHPRCRYGPSCSKPKCQFMHTKLPVVANNTSQAVSFSSSTIPTNPPQTSASTLADTNGSQKQVSEDSTGSQSTPTALLPALSIPVVAPTAGPDVPLASPPTSLTVAKNTLILCRYAGKCQNINCPYKHPPPCRFGMNCMNFSYCSFLHRKPNQFAGNRYKWVAPSLSL